MSRFFKPYEGKRPFIFVSYPHKSSDIVVDTIRILNDKDYRVWYDEGIPAGSDWPANIANHMSTCDAVIFFNSERAIESPNCFSEMRTADRMLKPVLKVNLEPVDLNYEWAKILRDKPEIPVMNSAEEYSDAILKSGFLRNRHKKKWSEQINWRVLGISASVLLLFASALGLAGLISGKWNPIQSNVEPYVPQPTVEVAVATSKPTVNMEGIEQYFAVSFPDSQQEKAIRSVTGIKEEKIVPWNLANIQELYFCGNMVRESSDGIYFDSEGNCRVNGAKVSEGKVKDIGLFENMVRLEKLYLVYQPVKDISALSGHVLLNELSLAGSDVESLDGLDNLPSLEILHLEHTKIKDLNSLNTFSGLKTVTVSRDMLPIKWSENSQFDVILISDK